MFKKISIYLLFICSLLFAILFFLLQGVTFKSLTFPGVKIAKFYIKLDKKLILDVEEIVISKKSKVENSIDDIKKDIKNLQYYLKYFQKIHIEKLLINGNEFVIEINEDILFLDNKFINISAKPLFKKNSITLDLYSLYLKDYDVVLEGKADLDYKSNISNFEGTYLRKNVSGTLNAKGNNRFFNFRIDSNDLENIHFLKDFVRLNPAIEKWMYDNVLGKFKLNHLSGKVSSSTFEPYLDTFKASGTVSNAKIKFHDDVDVIKTDLVTISFDNDKLAFDLLKPKYKDIDINGSGVIINNISGKNTNIDVNLYSKNKLNKDVLDIVKAYGITLPVLQLDGNTDSQLNVNVNFTTKEVTTIGKFKTSKANFKLGDLIFLATDATVTLRDSNVYIKNAQINYNDVLDSKLDLTIDAKNENATGTINIKSFDIKADTKEIVSVKNKQSKINVDFSKQVTIDLVDLFTNLKINDKSFDVNINNLENVIQYSKLLKNLNVKKGNLFLSIYNLDDIFFRANIYDLNLPLKKYGNMISKLDIEGNIKNNIITAKTTNDKIKFRMNDDVVNLYIKDTDLIIKEKDNEMNNLNKNIVLQLENSYIELYDKYEFDVSSLNLYKNKDKLFFDAKLQNIDLPLKKENKKYDNISMYGEYTNNILILDSIDYQLHLEVKDDDILIKVSNHDILYDTNDDNDDFDKKIKIIADKSNIIINDKYKLLSDKFSINIEKNSLQFDSSFNNSSINYYKNENGNITILGNDLNDIFINSILANEFITGGSINFNANGKKDKVEGKIIFKDNKVKNLAFINNLIVILNTTPALINPFLAIPTAVDIVSNKGISVNGYYINKGYADFIYDINKNVFNAKKIDTEGSIVDFEGYAILDFENSTINSVIDVAFMKAYTNVIKYVPLVNYIFLGDDKKITTKVDITGKLEDPEYETHLTKEGIKVPLKMLERIFTLPSKAIDSLKGDK